MIQISIYRDKTGRIRRFVAQGHSGYAPHGEDIVCAAVSALVQTAVLGLEGLTQITPGVVVEDGNLDCQISGCGGDNIKVDAILETMLLGLQAIEADYPAFVSICQMRI